MKKIFNNILHRFKEDSLNKRSENCLRQVEYKGLKEIKKCLVFWCANADQNKWIKQVEIGFKQAQVDKLCFIPDDIEMLETDDVVAMRNTDLGFSGKIQNERLLALLDRRYDLLIDLTPESGAFIKYILTNTQSACIAGMKKEGGFADIVVDEVSQPIEFITKLTEILSGINKY